MSVSVQQILCDAKRLVSRLREQDSAADGIISQTQTLYKNVEAMKEYYEDVSVDPPPPLVYLSSSIGGGAGGESNRHILDLQKENRELRDLLEEHQSALQLIMSRYRQRITQQLSLLGDNNNNNNNNEGDNTSQALLQCLADEVCGMAAVMRDSVTLDDAFWAGEQERLSELLAENRGLLEMLDIARQYGSLHPPLNPPGTHDQATQTEDTHK